MSIPETPAGPETSHGARPPRDLRGGGEPPQVYVDTRLPVTSARAVRELFAKILRRSAIVVAVIAVLTCGAGYLLSGTPGLWGALVGVALAAFYLLVTVVVMLVTADRSQTVLSAAIGGSWLIKTVVTIGVVVALRAMDFYDPRWLVGTVAAAVLATLAVEMHAVATSRIGLDLPADRRPADRGASAHGAPEEDAPRV